MVKSIVLGLAFYLGVHVVSNVSGADLALACNRTAGCVMDNMWENYDMMHSDKMKDAMSAGKDNIQAFRRLQEAERKHGARTSKPRR